MPYILEDQRIAFFNCPKVASSTVLKLMFEIKNGSGSFKKLEGRSEAHDAVHYAVQFIPRTRSNWERISDYWKFTVVRDPIERMFSVYSDRVLRTKDQLFGKLSRTRLRLLGLPFEPDLDTYFSNLKKYNLVSGALRHHARPQSWHIGTDLSVFDRVYALEDLEALVNDISDRTGFNSELSSLKRSKKNYSLCDLNIYSTDRLFQYTRSDYQLLSDLYDPPLRERAS